MIKTMLHCLNTMNITKNTATATAERLLPQSLDAERSVLGSIILDRDEIGQVVQIPAENFYLKLKN